MTRTIDSDLFVTGARLKREEIGSLDEYPFSLPAVRGFTRIELRSPVTFFVGENGSGKSTLLEALATAWGFNPEDSILRVGPSTFHSGRAVHILNSESSWSLNGARNGRRMVFFSVPKASTMSLLRSNGWIQAGQDPRSSIRTEGGHCMHNPMENRSSHSW
jgi:energy-coupling factor transporter ATP-binding protein EcfA2